jgi:hypothetical protein
MALADHHIRFEVEEQLRLVSKLKGARAGVLLAAWLQWARRCRIPAFAELAKKIGRHQAGEHEREAHVHDHRHPVHTAATS